MALSEPKGTSGAAALLAAAMTAAIACSGARSASLDPRYVAVHNTLAALGLVEIGPLHQGSLAEGREARLALALPAGCSTIVALGGPGVADLDVVLLDADDAPVLRDTTTDAEPSLRVCLERPAQRNAVVRMTRGQGDFIAATWSGAVGPAVASSLAATAEPKTGDGTCASPLVLAPGTIASGDTRRGTADNEAGCASSESREVVYRLVLDKRQRVVLEVDPQFDSVLYVRRTDCEDPTTEVACNDDRPSRSGASNAHGSRVDEVLEPGTYYVFVDGYGTESGGYRLKADVSDVPSLADACKTMRPLGAATVTGTFDTAFDHTGASCGGEARGPDRPYRLDLAGKQRVRVTLHAADAQPVVHLRRACSDTATQIGCGDDGLAGNGSVWSALVEGGSYALFADARERGSTGEYILGVETAPEAGGGTRGDACSDALVLGAGDRRVDGDTFPARDDVATRCAAQGSADVLYRFELARRSRVIAKVAAEEGQHVLALRRSCVDASSELACAASVDEVLAPGPYYLAVESRTASSFGRFSVSLQVRNVGAIEAACKAAPLLAPGQTVRGTTSGAEDNFRASCAGPEDRQASPDRVFRIALAHRARVRLSLATPTWDGVLVLKRSCVEPPNAASVRAAELVCNNDHHDARHAQIETTLDPGTYHVVVDGHLARNEGPFTLEYRVLP